VREDLQRAREIIVKDGFSGLFRALQRGAALPAAVGLLAPLMFGPPEQDAARRIGPSFSVSGPPITLAR
jgi:hypothetical protein